MTSQIPASTPALPDEMPPDEALAVLRHGVRDEVEARAVDALGAELVRLRAGRQEVLTLSEGWERSGGLLGAWPIIRAVRMALGAW